MKRLSLIDKFLFLVNSLLATILLTSYLSYYISPNTISIIGIVSLSIPFLIIINLFFVVYWLLKLKKQFLLSLTVLLIGYQYFNSFYNFNEKKILLNDDVKIMSYNVRKFNVFKWIKDENIDQKIYDFINKKQPDILCIQEYPPSKKIGFTYPYKHIKARKKSHLGHAIFSKYKIINSGSLNFSNTNNNAIFADIVKNNDTIRVYNIHLQSMGINPKEEEISQKNGEKLRVRVEKAFKTQANQVELIKLHMAKNNYKSIVCGDFNNTAYSWVYHELKEHKNDAFEEAGKGFGKTYDFAFPLRIDFILTDKDIAVNNFKTYDVKYSDHYPIMARVNFE
jgi:endonuclease/exonuclease/phosphatase family metal-dependent hydrolase